MFLSSPARQNAVQQKNLQSTSVTIFNFSSGVTKRNRPNIAKPRTLHVINSKFSFHSFVGFSFGGHSSSWAAKHLFHHFGLTEALVVWFEVENVASILLFYLVDGFEWLWNKLTIAFSVLGASIWTLKKANNCFHLALFILAFLGWQFTVFHCFIAGWHNAV